MSSDVASDICSARLNPYASGDTFAIGISALVSHDKLSVGS